MHQGERRQLSALPLPGASARRAKFWRLFVIYLALGLTCAWLSQWLPVAEAGKRMATRIWGPVLTDSYPTTGRDQVTVMLIDDKDLREYGEVWPVSLGFHERRLLELLKYRPKAVFFDIVFLDDRKDPDLAGFIDAACKARQAGVPVFVGSFGNAGFTPSRTEAAMLARRVTLDGRMAPCIEAAYLNLRIDGYDQSVWEYDVDVPAQPVGGLAPAAVQRFPSPAARLYQVDHRLDPHVAAEPMALVWGTASDPRNLEWLNSDLRPGGPGPACSASWEWTRVLPVGKAAAPICPYQQLLPIRTLKRTHGLDSQQLDEAIRNKYIIYGTHLQSNGDVILAPYHGRIAGAFLHAMALDNLLSFDGAPKAGGDFGQPWFGAASGFTLFAVAVISALIAAKNAFEIPAALRSRASGWLSAWQPGTVFPGQALPRAVGGQLALGAKHLLLWLIPQALVGVAYFVAIAILVPVSYFLLKLGPLVWIEFVLFPIGMDFLQLGDKADEWRAQATQYLRGIGQAIRAPRSEAADILAKSSHEDASV